MLKACVPSMFLGVVLQTSFKFTEGLGLMQGPPQETPISAGIANPFRGYFLGDSLNIQKMGEFCPFYKRRACPRRNDIVTRDGEAKYLEETTSKHTGKTDGEQRIRSFDWTVSSVWK